MTSAQLLQGVEQYAAFANAWRVEPVLSPTELVAAIQQASTNHVNASGDPCRVAFAVQDLADMRATAESQLFAILQCGISVIFVSRNAAELFPSDDEDLASDMSLLTDDELEALAFEPGALDDVEFDR